MTLEQTARDIVSGLIAKNKQVPEDTAFVLEQLHKEIDPLRAQLDAAQGANERLRQACQAAEQLLAADEEILIDWDENGLDAQVLHTLRAALEHNPSASRPDHSEPA